MPGRGTRKNRKSTFHRRKSLDYFIGGLPEALAETAWQIVADGKHLNLQIVAEKVYTLACKELSPEDLEQAVGKAEELKADAERKRAQKRKRGDDGDDVKEEDDVENL